MREFTVKYDGHSKAVPLRARYSQEAAEDMQEFHGLNIEEEGMRLIVEIAGDNYREDHHGCLEVKLEIFADGASVGSFVSLPDGTLKPWWKFKEDAKPVVTDDFWYDVTEGGYINIVTLLNDGGQIKKFNDAITTLQGFVKAADEAGLLDLL